MKKTGCVFVFAVLMAMLGSAVIAQEAAKQEAAPSMTPEQQAQMKKMKALTSPTEAHKVLEPFVGKWSYTSKFWMSPDQKPEESSGTAEHAMIFGGRFLKEDIKGTWMGEAFEGIGYIGYDNIKAEYVSIWIDGMATGIMKVSGQYDAATKTLKQSGSNSCPLTGEKDRQGRSEWTMTDNDHNTYSMYGSGPDGKEFRMMEILYTRAQ